MFNSFLHAPYLPGLEYLGTTPVTFLDHRVGRPVPFPVHHYRDCSSGEEVLVTEDRFEPILDKLIELGQFGHGGAQ